MELGLQDVGTHQAPEGRRFRRRNGDAQQWHRKKPGDIFSCNRKGFCDENTRIDTNDAKHTTSHTAAEDNGEDERDKGRIEKNPFARFISGAFHTRFPLNNRIREWVTFANISGFKFVVVERAIVGYDDTVYRTNRKVWEHVPRGQACVFAASQDNDTFTQVVVLQGLRKFGYFDAPYGVAHEEPVAAVSLDAIDGDCGQLAAFTYGGERFWLVGSKNAHLLARFHVPEEDLSLYSNAKERNDDDSVSPEIYLPIRMARLWRDTLGALPKDKATALHDFLGTAGHTLCFEAILEDSGHLVDYGPGESLKFYAITCCNAPSRGGLCAELLSSTETLRFYGLDVVPHNSPQLALGSSEYVAHRSSVVRRMNSKGVVLYGINAVGTVVRLWKLRSHTYTIERAAQEAIVTHGLSGAALRTKLTKKLARLPKDVRQCLIEWESTRLECLVQLAAWLHVTGQLAPSMELGALQRIRRRWISLQREFTKLTAFDMHMHMEVMRYEPPIENDVRDDPDVVLCVGPQGCGKSTFSRTLFALLQQAGQSPQWINQDEVGNRRLFLEAIRRAKHAGYTHLIIDKMNLDEAARADYATLGLKTLAVTWSHPDGTRALLDVCVDRIFRRGLAHRTFAPDEGGAKRIHKILRSCVARYRPPTEGTLVEVNVADSIATIVARVWDALCAHGITDLPEFNTLGVAAALNLSNAYESFLHRFPRPIKYAALQITSPQTIIAMVPEQMLEGKKTQKHLHITTAFLGVGVCPNPVVMVQLAELIGTSIDITLTHVFSDAKGTAIAVRNEGEFPCVNAHPHITIATASGIPPKYSNELLDESHANDPCLVVVALPAGTRVTATFAFVFE